MATSIKQWATDDRPREKLQNNGAESLSNSELLAILILNGTKDKSAVDLAKDVMHAVNNNLHKLGCMSAKEITKLKIKGLGPAKAIAIAAAMELGIRRTQAENKKDVISKSGDIAHFLRAKFQHKKHEVFAVVFLNKANKVNHWEIISEGGIAGTIADPRIIFRKALEYDAVSLVLCHNHPSGSLKPSRQDEELTARLKEAARFLDIKIVDHIIVSEEGYYSFADEGIL